MYAYPCFSKSLCLFPIFLAIYKVAPDFCTVIKYVSFLGYRQAAGGADPCQSTGCSKRPRAKLNEIPVCYPVSQRYVYSLQCATV